MDCKEKREKIKEIIVKNLELLISPEEIGDEQPLFDTVEGSLALDSVEALEIIAGLEDEFDISIELGDDPKEDLYSVATLEKLVARCELEDE